MLPRGSRLRLGFPHWYYALRHSHPDDSFPPRPPTAEDLSAFDARGPLPTKTLPLGLAHWYVETRLRRDLPVGDTVTLRMRRWLAPQSAGDIEPLVLLAPGWLGRFEAVAVRADQPAIQPRAGPPEHLALAIGEISHPGEALRPRYGLRDHFGNACGGDPRPSLRWLWVDDGAEREVAPPLPPIFDEDGLLRAPSRPGPWILEASAPGLISARAAVLVDPEARAKLIWADLHGHSGLSDGRGSPDSWYRHAHDVALLDAAALSDHDWQLEARELSALLDAAEAANKPGDFVAVPALELNLVGHEVAWFFEPRRLAALGAGVDGGARTIWEESDLDRRAARLQPPAKELLDAVGSERFLLATHTSMHRSMGADLDAALALPSVSMIEIYSAHGSSECASCPRSLNWDAKHGSVRQALELRPDLAFYAAGDSHDGRPGDNLWGAYPGGLAGIWVTGLSRPELHSALRAGRVYGTSGQRSVIQFERLAGSHRLRVHDIEPIRRIVIVRDGEEIRVIDAPPRGRWIELPDTDPSSLRSLYVRVEFEGGGLAWATATGSSRSRSPSPR